MKWGTTKYPEAIKKDNMRLAVSGPCVTIFLSHSILSARKT